jgi:uncharacterized protein YdiU (UPF0061 family)
MKFDNTYDKLPEVFFSESTPQDFSDPQLLVFNEKLANDLGIDLKDYNDESLAQIFSGQQLLEGSHVISTVYAAHQFGNFVPSLGDGRAMLLGEVVDPQGHRFDIQLKGSGRTAYSRGGDGLSPLGPVVREYIVSEAMHHLGVPATRALAAVTTGDRVFRQGELPGGVITRVASSHIRIGTFQYFASKGDLESLIALLDHTVNRHYPEILKEVKEDPENSKTPLLFLRRVIQSQVSLVSHWMSLGFIHGVMNTDNTTVCGETIDFGPCAFMDRFKHDQVFSSIDSYGRYSYSNQKDIAAWNLCRLADCLIQLVDAKQERAVEKLNTELSGIYDLFEAAWQQRMIAKFGLSLSSKKDDEKFIKSWLDYLEKEQLDFTLSFRKLADLLDNDTDDFFVESDEFNTFQKEWQKRLKAEGRATTLVKEEMNKVNPLYIPRNHQVEKAIEAAMEGDLTVFNEMNEVLTNPFTYQENLHQYSVPPLPKQEVKATFCGT